MSERKYGNYHVLHGAFDGWQVAEYCEDGWLVTGIQDAMTEGDFEEIGPRIPTPDEPWQMVPVELGDNRRLRHALFPLGDPQAQEEHWRDVLAAAPKP